MDYGAILQMVGALAGAAKSGQASDEQIALAKKQLAQLAGIPLPELEKVIATQLPPSAVAALQTDTGLRQNQLETIAALKEISQGGGMALDDKVAQEAANSRAMGAARRSRAGLSAELASRGQLNSGAAMQMGMAAEQQNANSARQSGMEAAASAQRRKMEALRDIAGQSGALRSQDRAEASEAARAADDRARWIANGQEKAQYFNAGLPQQNFQNQMAKATGQMPATNALSAAIGNQGRDQANRLERIGAVSGEALNQGMDSLRGSSTKPDDTYSWAPPREDLDWSNPYYSQKLQEDDEK